MLQLAAALNRGRYAPLALFTEPGPIFDFARELGVPAQVLPLRSAFCYGAQVPVRFRMSIAFLSHFWSTVRATRQFLAEYKPDLVHLNTSVLVPVAMGVKRAGIPLVWHVREVPGLHPRLRRWQTGTILRLADHVITTSEYVRAAFATKSHTTAVHNAVRTEFFSLDTETVRNRIRAEFGLSSAVLVVGMIGSVQAEKGHYLLLEAARTLVRSLPEARFLIVAGGVGPEYASSWKGRLKRGFGIPFDNLEKMRLLVAESGLERHFIFTGFRQDIPEVLTAVDVLAFLPQAAEGFGRPLIEAMAIGCPVVASDIGPSREILGDSSGILIPPSESSSLTEALLRLLRDPALRVRLGQTGRQRVRSHFTLEQHVQAVEAVYQKVLEQRKPVVQDHGR